MRHVIKTAAVAAMAMVAGKAFAEDASLRFAFPILSYGSESEKSKANEDADEVKTDKTMMSTADAAGIEVLGQYKEINVYVWPWSGNNMVGVSYDVMKALEVGVKLGLNSSTSKVEDAKTETSDNSMGVFGFYYLPLGAANLELGLDILSTTAKTKSPAGVDDEGNATAEGKTNTTGMDITLSVEAAVELAKNFEYVGGLRYAMSNQEEKEAKSKSDSTGFSLNLATLRYTLN